MRLLHLLPAFAFTFLIPNATAIKQLQGADKDPTKYFKEPGGDHDLGHYDFRYFTKKVGYDERTEGLHHLIRALLTVFRSNNIETWLAHGTLLGWWWNGRIMPWDGDLDVQVSHPTLAWLGNNLNMTMQNYTYMDDKGKEQTREYLVDINPRYAERGRGDGMNVIDGRFIDVTNGLFVDITGLSETNPQKFPGIWKCKNEHKYRTRDIFSLRETEFEGVPALVPYDFDRVLAGEYTSAALTRTEFEGHSWVPEQKEWVPKDAAKKLSHKGSKGDGWRGKAGPRGNLLTGKVSRDAEPEEKEARGDNWNLLGMR